jgi:RNA polymerase sigma-32 factor
MMLDPSYARTVDNIPTMPAAEQAMVAARYARTRDPRDAERLVLGNLRLVVKIARELGPHRHDLMDLVQEGNAGLTHAVQRFDPTRGVKLTSYAAWWIRATIMRHMMATSRMVSFASTREGRRRYFDRSLPGPDQSLDERGRRQRDGGSLPGSLLDRLADDDANRPDLRYEEREYDVRLQQALHAFRPTLDERGRGIFDLRLLRERPARLADVGKRFAVSGERIRQLEARVRGDLRSFVAGALGEPERAAA